MTIKNIRNTAVSKLLTADIVGVGTKVHNSKITANLLDNTPSIIVYTDSVSAASVQGLPAFMSNVDLQIDVIVALAANWADTADDIVSTVISVLMSDNDFTSLFNHLNGYTVGYNFISDAAKPVCTAEIKISGSVFEPY